MNTRRVKCFSLLLFTLFPVLAFGTRPYIGFEYGIFMPQGEWAEKMGTSTSFRASIHQSIYKWFGAALTASYVSLASEDAPDCELTMRPLIYLDALAEKTMREHPLVVGGVFMGMTYSNQKVAFEQGVEEAAITGHSFGVLLSTRFLLAKKVYIKARFVFQEATKGNEISLGVNF